MSLGAVVAGAEEGAVRERAAELDLPERLTLGLSIEAIESTIMGLPADAVEQCNNCENLPEARLLPKFPKAKELNGYVSQFHAAKVPAPLLVPLAPCHMASASRRSSSAAVGGELGATWEWMTQRGTWQQHSWRICHKIERAFQSGKTSVSVESPAGICEVDLQKMTQRFRGAGSVAGREWRVRRTQPSTDVAPTTTPSSSSSSSSASTTPSSVSQLSSSPSPHQAESPQSSSGRATPPLPPARGSNNARTGAAIVRSGRRATASGPRQRPPSTECDEALAQMLAMEEQQQFLLYSGAADAVVRQMSLGAAQRGPSRPRRGASEVSRRRTAPALAVLPAELGEDPEILSMLFWQEELSGGLNAAGGRAREAVPHPQSNPDALDVDRMSYEELVQLGERVGYAERPNKPTRSMVARLPTWRYGEGSGQQEGEEECPVCCDDYKEGDEMRMLPCFHSFHARCIDEWLLSDMPGASLCPVCNTRVEL